MNPSIWPNGSTQYGLLMTWEVRRDGAYINETRASDIKVEELDLMSQPYIDVKIGNKEGTKYVGDLISLAGDTEIMNRILL